jgi:hypothetical protein
METDGTIDTSFSNTNTGNYIASIAIQTDGKIVIGGPFTSIGSNPTIYSRFIRLTSDGSVDTTFYPNITTTTTNSGVYTIAIKTDGIIAIGGWFDAICNTFCRNFAVINNPLYTSAILKTPYNNYGYITQYSNFILRKISTGDWVLTNPNF